MGRVDEAWKGEDQVRVFLEGIRGAIPFFDAQLDTMMRLIEGLDLRTFLDLGCGDGILSSRVLAAFPNARGVLLDFSPPMLQKARRALGGRGAGIEFVEADLSDPDWAAIAAGASSTKAYDLIVSGYAIHHQPGDVKKRIYGAVFDLLDQGGIFINIDHVASPSERVRRISNNLFLERLRAFHEAENGPGDFEAVKNLFQRRVDGEAKVLSPVWEQCNWLKDIGFVEVDCFFKSFELAVFGGRRPMA